MIRLAPIGLCHGGMVSGNQPARRRIGWVFISSRQRVDEGVAVAERRFFSQISPRRSFKMPLCCAHSGLVPLSCGASTRTVALEFATSSSGLTKTRGRFPVGKRPLTCIFVGVAGFEPTTSSSRTAKGMRSEVQFQPSQQVRASACFGLDWSLWVRFS